MTQVSTARASAGTVALPFGLPAASTLLAGFGLALAPGPPRPSRAPGASL
jgi:hypothetical protein